MTTKTKAQAYDPGLEIAAAFSYSYIKSTAPNLILIIKGGVDSGRSPQQIHDSFLHHAAVGEDVDKGHLRKLAMHIKNGARYLETHEDE